MAACGMEQCSRAMQKADERQGQGSVTVRLAAKLRGQTALQEFERRHVFFAREGDGPIFSDEAVVIGMGDKEVENAAAQQGKKIFFVGKTFVKRGSRGSRGASYSAHGQCMFPAPAPQAIGGLQDAAFETCVGFTRHAAILPLYMFADYILYSVKDTMYK